MAVRLMRLMSGFRMPLFVMIAFFFSMVPFLLKVVPDGSVDEDGF